MSIYDVSYLGTASNRITFNGTTLPIYRVVSRAPQRRQIRDLDIPIPFESGMSDFQTLEGGSAYIIEGIMYPGNETDYDNGLAALRKVASLDVEQADVGADTGYVPYIYTEATGNKQVFVKVLYVDLPESTRKGLVQPFRLVCKVKDPTIFSASAKTASTQGTDPTTLGGSAIFSFAFPIVYGASRFSVSNVATNSGDLPAYPSSIYVYGPVNNPIITNVTTGEYISVSTNLSTSSDVLLITYDKDSLSVTKNGVSILNSVASATTFFKLRPGANSITLTGTLSSGAYCVVNYFDTWPLS
jgi:hypothetical protein